MEFFETFSSILMIICSVFGIVCALLFILITCLDRQCHRLTVLLVLNSTLAGLIANITCIAQAIHQLVGITDDVLCTFRGFLLQSSTGMLYHTLCVQAFHRLFVTVHSTRASLQRKRVSLMMVIFQWLISGTFALPLLLTDRIPYHRGSRICQVNTIHVDNQKPSLHGSFVVGLAARSVRFYLLCIDYLCHSSTHYCFHLSSYRHVYEKESVCE